MICLIEAKAQGQQKAGDVYVTRSGGISWEEERRDLGMLFLRTQRSQRNMLTRSQDLSEVKLHNKGTKTSLKNMNHQMLL